MSLAWFQQAQVDIAVVEVGLGGRWDATNVIEAPLVSVLTPIDWDHVEVLGPTLTHIAGEKAGIIKPGRPVVVSPAQPPEALRVFHETAHAKNAPLILGEALSTSRLGLAGSPPLSALLGTPHRENLPLRLTRRLSRRQPPHSAASGEVLRTQGWTIPDTAVEKGLQYAAQTAPLWGRTQWILHEKSPILLEVAHNPQGFAALRKLLEKAPYQIEIASDWLFGRQRLPRSLISASGLAHRDMGCGRPKSPGLSARRNHAHSSAAGLSAQGEKVPSPRPSSKPSHAASPYLWPVVSSS
jgi:dihydrofolate synthase / folylpolyglutamate synthase